MNAAFWTHARDGWANCRTPKVNKDSAATMAARHVRADAARHPRGQVIGGPMQGYYASENVHSPEDFAASLYTKMGIDPHQILHTNTGPHSIGQWRTSDQRVVRLNAV